jgi:hypothetical protein
MFLSTLGSLLLLGFLLGTLIALFPSIVCLNVTAQESLLYPPPPSSRHPSSSS